MMEMVGANQYMNGPPFLQLAWDPKVVQTPADKQLLVC